MVDGSKIITTKENLDIFLYLLLRDHLPAGVVEQIVQDIESNKAEAITFCNGFVAEYAQQLAKRLTTKRGPSEDSEEK